MHSPKISSTKHILLNLKDFLLSASLQDTVSRELIFKCDKKKETQDKEMALTYANPLCKSLIADCSCAKTRLYNELKKP